MTQAFAPHRAFLDLLLVDQVILSCHFGRHLLGSIVVGRRTCSFDSDVCNGAPAPISAHGQYRVCRVLSGTASRVPSMASLPFYFFGTTVVAYLYAVMSLVGLWPQNSSHVSARNRR